MCDAPLLVAPLIGALLLGVRDWGLRIYTLRIERRGVSFTRFTFTFLRKTTENVYIDWNIRVTNLEVRYTTTLPTKARAGVPSLRHSQS